MAQVTKKKAPAKKAAAKKAPAVSRETPAESTLTPADLAMIAEIAAKAAAEAVKAAVPEKPAAPEVVAPANGPGGRVVEPTVYETNPLSPEEIASMSEEQIAEYNARESAKMRARKARQKKNLNLYENKSVAERMRLMSKPRDPNVIRLAAPDDWDGDEKDLVRVVCRRSIGLMDGGMSEVDEQIDMPRENARVLQKSGVIEVAI